MGFLEKLFRIDARAYAKIRKKARPTFDYEDEFKKMTDAKLKEETPKLKQMLANGASVDDILPEAFDPRVADVVSHAVMDHIR